MKDATYIHIPSGQSVRIKKVYGDVATCYVEPYPISITWGKEEYSDSIIVKTQDLKLINNPQTTEK